MSGNRFINPHDLNWHSHACVVTGRCVEGKTFSEIEEQRLRGAIDHAMARARFTLVVIREEEV